MIKCKDQNPCIKTVKGLIFSDGNSLKKKNFPELLPKCVDFNSLPAEDSKAFF